MAWEIIAVREVARWILELDDATYSDVEAALDELQDHGPNLGRPHVGRIKGSTLHHNLKELRVSTVRILYVFDPERNAVLLLGGSKAGQWNRWYSTSPLRSTDTSCC